MRNIVFIGGIGELCGGNDLAEAFDVLCFLTTNVRDGVADTGVAQIFIAILLQLSEPDRTLVESLYDPGVFVRVGEERGSGLRVHEQGSELGGGDLEADFRKLRGIVFAEVIGEVILEERGEAGSPARRTIPCNHHECANWRYCVRWR